MVVKLSEIIDKSLNENFFELLSKSPDVFLKEYINLRDKNSFLKKYYKVIINENDYLYFQMACFAEQCKLYCKNFLKRKNKKDIFYKNDFYKEAAKKVFDTLIELDIDFVEFFVFEFIDKDINLMKKLAYHDDLRVRAVFMKILVEKYNNYIDFYYPDNLSKYLVKFDEEGHITEKAKEEYVSLIAASSLKENYEIIFVDLYNFIINNYEYNHLATFLNLSSSFFLRDESDFKDKFLDRYLDELFKTSLDSKFSLYMKYKNVLSNELVKEYEDSFYHVSELKLWLLDMFLNNELSNNFIRYSKEYLEKSTGAKFVSYLRSGSRAVVLRVGDYVIKYSNEKMSQEKCPDLYLINKNYEEDIIRDDQGDIIGCLEVQKFLSKPLIYEEQCKIYQDFMSDLRELGYEYDCEDLIRNSLDYSNLFYLEDYHDADCENPEELPEWFKESPVVLVDRDNVIKLEKYVGEDYDEYFR